MPTRHSPPRPRTAFLLVLAVIGSLGLLAPATANAEESDATLVISQVYGGGGNSGATYTHDFVELFNRGDAEIDLTGWSVQYASSSGSSWQVTPLSGRVPPGHHYLVRQARGAGGSLALPEPDATGSIPMSSSNGKTALVAGTEALSGGCPLDQTADFVGFGSANCFEGTGATPSLSNTLAAHRADGGCTDTDDNTADFGTAEPDPRNLATTPVDCDGGPTEPDVTVTCPDSPVPGFDVSATEGYAAQRTITAAADGPVTDMTATVEPVPAAGDITLGEPTGGEPAAATLTIGDTVPPGAYTVTVTATTADGKQGSCVAAVEVMPLVPIGAVQGAIADDQTDYTSPLLGRRVAVRGVVTQLTMEGSGSRGFFLQERAAGGDGDPDSSDGVFVYNGDFQTLRTEVEGPARDQVGPNWNVTVGDEIVLRGTVDAYFGMTQFGGGSSFVWDVTDTGLDVDATVAVADVDPPDDAADAQRYFRRHLGMQLRVPADSVVVAGRDVFSGTDAEVWAIRGDHPVAGRTDEFGRRVFRDVHPLDNDADTGFDDGNGYRFVLGSFGVKGSGDDPDAVLAPAKTFDRITEANRGGVYLSFGKYTVNVAEQLALDTDGTDPSANAPVRRPDRETESSIAAYNVENLYDHRDSPESECDFDGDPGCDDGEETVTPPFDYVPGSEAEYQDRLSRMADQIRLDLHGPDVLLIQETEAQDVCTISAAWTPETGAQLGADRLDCDLDNTGEANTRADGRPDSLTELALVIAEQGGPEYAATFDADAGDLRGISTAFLYRVDRVELLPAAEDDPVLGADPGIDYPGEPLPMVTQTQNPKAFNAALPQAIADQCTSSGAASCDGSTVFSRGAQVGLFRIWRDQIGVSTWADAYLVNNHFSSGPENRVLQRAEQAAYNARLADAVLAADPDARLLVGGDLNVFPRPDDPYAPGAEIPGIGTGPSDQLAALYDSGLTNLYDRLLADHPAAAYSYGYQGQAQTLDHLWVSPALSGELVDVRSAKINVDWPADAAGEQPEYGRFGISDHDPGVARFGIAPGYGDVRDLVGRLTADGELARPWSWTISAHLTTAEWLDARDPRVASLVLSSLTRQIDALARAGHIDGAVADGLTAEIELLKR